MSAGKTSVYISKQSLQSILPGVALLGQTQGGGVSFVKAVRSAANFKPQFISSTQTMLESECRSVTGLYALRPSLENLTHFFTLFIGGSGSGFAFSHTHTHIQDLIMAAAFQAVHKD